MCITQFSLEYLQLWFYWLRRYSMSLFIPSAIGTSTDPHRASLAIAGPDHLRFTLSIVPHLHACVFDGQRSRY